MIFKVVLRFQMSCLAAPCGITIFLCTKDEIIQQQANDDTSLSLCRSPLFFLSCAERRVAHAINFLERTHTSPDDHGGHQNARGGFKINFN